MAPSYRVEGVAAKGFEPVKETFEKLFRQGREACSQLCVYQGQEKVVDLWGSADGDKSYGPDTQQIIFSSSKCVTALVVACMVDKGLLSYDEKVSKYWPEFAQNGKENVTVADVMRHEAGLAYIHHTWKDDQFTAQNIKRNLVGKVIEDAKQKFPHESRGTDREYHSLTRGLILNEIFRRVEPNGRTIGEYLREEICEPLQARVIIGASLKEAQELKRLKSPTVGTVALHSLIPKPISHKVETSLWKMMKAAKAAGELKRNQEGETERLPMLESWSHKFDITKMENIMDTDDMKQGEFPSFNGIASARGLARLGACIVNGGTLEGVKILSEETVDKLMAEPIAKIDAAIPNNIITHMTQGGVAVFQ